MEIGDTTAIPEGMNAQIWAKWVEFLIASQWRIVQINMDLIGTWVFVSATDGKKTFSFLLPDGVEAPKINEIGPFGFWWKEKACSGKGIVTDQEVANARP